MFLIYFRVTRNLNFQVKLNCYVMESIYLQSRIKRTSYYGLGNSRLYVAKCLCLLSRIPFVSAGEHLLTALHSLFTAEAQPPPLPLESYIYWILNEVEKFHLKFI